MSTFRAFQTGLQAGQQQAKVRREDDARMKASEAFSGGNYEGASQSLMGVGLLDEANAYGQAGARKIEDERTKTYAQAFKTGLGAGPKPDRRAGYQALSTAAGEQGDFGTMQAVDQALLQMDEQQAAEFGQGMEFLGKTALRLKSVAPEMRGQAALEALQSSPYASPQIMAQIQQAAADGRITDEELDQFAMQTMSVADRVKMQREGSYTLGKDQVRYGPDNNVVASGPKSSPSDSARQPPSGYNWTPDGGLTPITGGPADPMRSGVDVDPKIIALETQQSGKWTPIQNNFQDIQSQYQRIETLAKRSDSAGDLGLVVSFTKMLDPGSVARESEVEMTQSAAGALEQAAMWGPRLVDGKTKLPDNVRKMFVDAAKDMYGVYENAYHGLAQDMQTRATQYGLSPERIMIGYEPKAPVKPQVAKNSAMQMGIRAYAKQSGLPAEAITEFLSNPATPDEIAEFNEAFGAGAAEAILKAMQGGR